MMGLLQCNLNLNTVFFKRISYSSDNISRLYCKKIEEKINQIADIKRIDGFKKMLRLNYKTGIKDQLTQLSKEVIAIIDEIPFPTEFDSRRNSIEIKKSVYKMVHSFFLACGLKIINESQDSEFDQGLAKAITFIEAISKITKASKITSELKYRFPDQLDLITAHTIDQTESIQPTKAA